MNACIFISSKVRMYVYLSRDRHLRGRGNPITHTNNLMHTKVSACSTWISETDKSEHAKRVSFRENNLGKIDAMDLSEPTARAMSSRGTKKQMKFSTSNV